MNLNLMSLLSHLLRLSGQLINCDTDLVTGSGDILDTVSLTINV